MKITPEEVESKVAYLERLQEKETSRDAGFEGPWLPSTQPTDGTRPPEPKLASAGSSRGGSET
jgi:hypothetical protein